MDTETNPGMDLTIPQLILALGEKLNNQDLSTTLTREEADVLERSGSLSLSKLRRWINSQLPINRLPREILILITTHLSDDKMLINLTHVCTHWRRIITTCPTFWTHIRFGGRDMVEALASLFFERAGGCTLDVHISAPAIRRRRPPRDQTIPTLPPGKRIRTLFINHTWTKIQEIMDRWGDALSPLQVLDINADQMTLPFPSMTFVLDALKHLRLFGLAVLGLDYIRAPNLTVLRLCDNFQTQCSATRLFDFLEATPALEEVSIHIDSTVVDDVSPPNRTVTLLHARSILLSISHVPQFASHLVCPSSTSVRLVDVLPDSVADGIFPSSLHRLLGQYSVGAVDRVVMRVSDRVEHKECSLQLHSPSDTNFQITYATEHFAETLPEDVDREWNFPVLFDQAVSALLSLPLGNVISFSIDIEPPSDSVPHSTEIAERFVEMFKKCPKLHEVVLDNYLPHCFSAFSQDRTPPIQVLIIKHPEGGSWEELAEHVTEAARIRHSRGVPLKRIEIITSSEGNPRIERLESWVQEVKYTVEPSQGAGRNPWF